MRDTIEDGASSLGFAFVTLAVCVILALASALAVAAVLGGFDLIAVPDWLDPGGYADVYDGGGR